MSAKDKKMDSGETKSQALATTQQDSTESSNTSVTLPAAFLSAVADLPTLPKHYNPIKHLPEAERNKLLDTLIDQYECGQSIYALAERLGVCNTTLYRQLVKHRTEDWKEVSAARYQSIIERCEKQIENASDALAVTRAREELANARWMLERLQRRIYGQDQPASGTNAVQININLRGEPATIAPQQSE